MHEYRSIHVMAVDSGTVEPFVAMSLHSGPTAGAACVASKKFALDQLDEVRDILGWASVAFLTAADELREDGWTIKHASTCPEGAGHGLTS